jgi:hypothetical protein
MNQIFSLKQLDLGLICYLSPRQNITFISYPGARDCLEHLSKLRCRSDVYPEFFYQLSQMCHNIQSLIISFKKDISNGLIDLISAQKNLKYLSLSQSYNGCKDLKDIITSITKFPNSLIRLNLDGGSHYIPISFIAKFTNLQELTLSFYNNDKFEDFNNLQYVTFSHLQVLKFLWGCPRHELLTKFLENNGKNLKEFYVNNSNNSLNLAIAKFCPNLRKLFSGFKNNENNELETLRIIFDNCQYLESIKIPCYKEYENDLFEVVAKHSPKNVCELRLSYSYKAQLKLLPEELESFFISWGNRIPQKSLTFVIIFNCAHGSGLNNENKGIIEKYIRLGVIKKFKITVFDEK